MLKDVLQSIAGVATFPVISLVLFFAFFIGVIIWIARMDKKTVSKMANLPLEKDDAPPADLFAKNGK
ncbi:MAG: cbb3-type cytochrome c oxidase subunit 3 [Deferribacteres bacterium]|nr:cbb3-type cytochrome c oxidase subunit 3 [candidate division KSB1 bacterium]MCB9512363.1 cbb3-type cytochrome c oxidase subunit 3 [Deferribacteres bacterium]